MSTKPKATAAKAAKKTSTAKRTRTTTRKKLLPILRNDPWLEPFAAAIEGRHAEALNKEKALTSESGSLTDLPTPTAISGSTARPTGRGCSASGRLMPRALCSLAISPTGRSS